MKSKGLEKLGFTPDVDFKLQDDGEGSYIKDWFSTEPQPTQAAVDAAYIEWENDYSRNRKEEYPSIEECVHAILDDDLVALQEKRAAVKARYPK